VNGELLIGNIGMVRCDLYHSTPTLPSPFQGEDIYWIPAFAGMTNRKYTMTVRAFLQRFLKTLEAQKCT
jgi:hypothetical protein